MPALVKIQYQSVGDDQATQTAKRVRQSLIDLGGASNAAAGSLGDKMTTAFQRLEQREPTMVLRRVRMEIETLGASLVGATGPLGRLGASLALLAPGGAVGLGAIAGFAGIGFEIKKLLDLSGNLEGGMTKASDAIAALGGAAAGAWADLRKLREQLDDLSTPGMFEHRAGSPFGATAGTTGGSFGGASTRTPGDVAAAAAQARESRLTTLQLGEELDLAKVHREHAAAVRRRDDELNHIQQLQIDAIAAHTAELKRLGDAARRDREAHERHALALFAETQSMVGAELGRFRNLGPAAPPISSDDAAWEAAFGPNAQGMIGTETTAQMMARRGGATGKALPKGAKLNTQALVAASLAAVGSASSGGLAGLLAGAGGIAEAIPGGQMIGTVLSGISALTGLFHSGHARITISRLESEAEEQMRRVMQTPQNVSANVLLGAGGDPRQAAQDLARVAARNGMSTLPR